MQTPCKYKRRISISFENSPSLTEQSHAESCDIHTIMRKYRKTGVLNHVAQYEGTYGHFASYPEFQDAQNIIAEAKSMFETVPAYIRADFDNDPALFLDFMQDPANKEAIADYGLSTIHLPDPKNDSEPPQAPTEPCEGDQTEGRGNVPLPPVNP